MIKEDKELLLRDLCSRLPYGVKVWYKYETWNSKKFVTSIRLVDKKIALSSKFNKEGDWFSIEEAGEILIKPYLRPMDDMTEEEINIMWEIYENNPCSEDSSTITELLNEWHIDHHHLIEKGLAIDCTGLNIY